MSKIAEWNFAADGTGASVVFQGTNPFQIEASGTFGGGTVVVNSSLDGGTTFIPLDGASFTANGRTGAFLATRGEIFQAVLSGATGPDLNVYIYEVVRA